MAKNTSTKSRKTSSKVQAQARREAQAKADRRTRNIIIGVVAAIIVVIVAIMVAVIVFAKNAGSTALPEIYSNGEPIVISSQGVGQRDPDVQDLSLAYSYTCGGCASLESEIGPLLVDDALAGKYNLVLKPVNTAYMEFQGPATNAALWVAAEDPTNFAAFHQALMTFANDEINVKKDPTVVTNLATSTTKVAELAVAAGVPADVVAMFGDSATDYLTAANANWNAENVEGRAEQPTTPEVVFANTRISPQGQTGTEIHTALIASMESLGLN